MRSSAQEQRTAIVAAAVTQLGVTGLDATPVEAIARRAQVSPAYVHRLFGTKSDLMLAAVAEHTHRLLTRGRPHDDDLAAWRRQLHVWAAAHDDVVREPARDTFRIMWDEAARAGEGPAEVRQHMAQAVLLTILASLDLMDLYEPEPITSQCSTKEDHVQPVIPAQ